MSKYIKAEHDDHIYLHLYRGLKANPGGIQLDKLAASLLADGIGYYAVLQRMRVLRSLGLAVNGASNRGGSKWYPELPHVRTRAPRSGRPYTAPVVPLLWRLMPHQIIRAGDRVLTAHGWRVVHPGAQEDNTVCGARQVTRPVRRYQSLNTRERIRRAIA
jgi:hypothetical protein